MSNTSPFTQILIKNTKMVDNSREVRQLIARVLKEYTMDGAMPSAKEHCYSTEASPIKSTERYIYWRTINHYVNDDRKLSIGVEISNDELILRYGNDDGLVISAAAVMELSRCLNGSSHDWKLTYHGA